MELKLSREDVTRILMEWAQGKFPGLVFNDATWTGYSYSREITLSFVEPVVQPLVVRNKEAE